MGRFTGILGLLTMLGLAYAFSTNRRAINKKTVVWGLGLQVVFAIFVLKIELGRILFQKAGDAVNRLLSSKQAIDGVSRFLEEYSAKFNLQHKNGEHNLQAQTPHNRFLVNSAAVGGEGVSEAQHGEQSENASKASHLYPL